MPEVMEALWAWAQQETGVEEPGGWLQERLLLGAVPMSLAELGKGCVCVGTHTPRAYVPALHHIKPQSWGGATVKANLILLCPNAHTATHRLLDNYVRAGTRDGIDTRHFSALSRALAAQAWEQRPAKPTITSLVRPAEVAS